MGQKNNIGGKMAEESNHLSDLVGRLSEEGTRR